MHTETLQQGRNINWNKVNFRFTVHRKRSDRAQTTTTKEQVLHSCQEMYLQQFIFPTINVLVPSYFLPFKKLSII